MELGQRIKRRREELGMSQDELAKKLGYRSRSSINKIEVDGRNIPQKKILAIANALNTTPAYIMGWEEESIDTLLAKVSKSSTDTDIEFIKIYLTLEEQQKKILCELARQLKKE